MKAVSQFIDPRISSVDIKKETRTLGVPEPTEVQVAVQATGLCGSDLHYYNHYRNGDIIVREPMTLGHESAGVITAIGSDVSDLNIGDHVALEVGLPCKACQLCETGRYNICKEMRFRSSAKAFPHFQGTLQERINHPAAYCHRYVFTPFFSLLHAYHCRLPSNLSLELGAILEPLSVAIHGSRRAALPKGKTVLIFGAGAVGLLCAAMCKVTGAKNIVIADIQPDRLDFALQNKFADSKLLVPMKRPQSIEDKLAFAKEVAELVKEASGEGEVDAVFECTGVESCLQASIYVCQTEL